MSKNIYLVYDAKIENNTTINKLLTVLDKAGFDVLDTVSDDEIITIEIIKDF